jgi:putative membrane protein
MSPEVLAFAAGFPVMLLHAVIGLGLLFAGSALYAFLSPHREIGLVRDANAAAAVSLGGVGIGLAIPLAAALIATTSALDILLWGGAVTVLALLIFRLLDLVLAGLPQRMREGEVSAAVVLTGARLAVAAVLAAALAI